jgi:hypothetical protein
MDARWAIEQAKARGDRKVHRITKEGRFSVLNTSPVLIPRKSRQHVRGGFSLACVRELCPRD